MNLLYRALCMLNEENKKKKNSSQRSARHANGMDWREEEKISYRPNRWLMPYQFSQHFMNNVIDYYCYILARSQKQKIWTSQCLAHGGGILISDQTNTNTHLIWSHVLLLYLWFVALFYLQLAIQKSYAYTHIMHEIASISTFVQIKYQSFATPHAYLKTKRKKKLYTTSLWSIDRTHWNRNMKTFLLLLSDVGSRSSFKT